MRTTMILMAPMFLLACDEVVGALNADSDGPSYDSLLEVCQRLDECGLLIDTTARQCADDADASLGEMTFAEAALCQTQINDCLSREECVEFALCDLSLCDL